MSSRPGKSARARIRNKSERFGAGGGGRCLLNGYSQLNIEKEFGFYNEKNGDSLEGFDLCFKGIAQEAGVRIDGGGKRGRAERPDERR